MLRVFQQTYAIAGALAGNHVFHFKLACDAQLVHVSLCNESANAGSLKIGKPGDDDGAPPDKHQRKEGDSEPVAQWRARMADDEVRQQYKQRAATAECVNALARNRGLQRLPVRGLGKVRAVAYLYALAHNLMRMVKIAPQLLGEGTFESRTQIGPG